MEVKKTIVNRRMHHRTRSSTMAKAEQQRIQAITFASRYLNDAEKKYSIGELHLLAVV